MAGPRPGSDTISDTGGDSVDPALAHTVEQAADLGDLVGTTVDRYRLLERLGAGGMGVVYAAHDPALDRKVALKVLPPLAEDRRGPLEARLRREAQALAQLDHPNVVGVYDVGVAAQSVFVAMQLVDGTTLADHLDAKPRTTREILDLFVAAGHGLAAAHEAEIVHRDVKPRNILVDRSGRAYIGDFGLARGTDADEDPPEPAPTPTDSLLHAEMTRVGAVLGTPVYMSPEQLRGEPATARSDQFGFCVSIWLALFGRHPFADGKWSVAVATAAMAKDEIRDPIGRSVPARVIRGLRRGLRHDPAERWPSMTALVAQLEPRSRAIWVGGGIALAGMIGAVLTTAWLMTGPDRAATCAVSGERIAAVWPGRQAELTKAFAAVGAEGEARVAQALSTYADRWQVVRRQTCEADAANDETSSVLSDMQARCLDDHLRVLGQLVDDLGNAKRPLLARALDAIAALPSPDDCATAAQSALPPAPARSLVEISDARALLAQAATLMFASQVTESRAMTARALATARTIGYQPLIAEALLSQATLQYQDEDAHTGETAASAAEIATAARADRVAARAYALALLAAADGPDYARMAALTPVARAAAHRVDEPSTTVLFTHAAAKAALVNGRYAEATELCDEGFRQAFRLELRHDPARGDAANDVDECFTTLAFEQGDIPTAATWAERWHGLAMERYGKDTLGTLPALRSLWRVRAREGKFDDALAMAQAALAITERALGPDSLELLEDLGTLVQMLHQAARTDEAIAAAHRLEAIVDKAGGAAGARQTMIAEMTLGQLYRMTGGETEMYRHYTRALAAGELGPPDFDQLATARLIVGTTLQESGDLDAAELLVGKAEATWVRTGNPRRYVATAGRAEILEQRGRCGDAIPLLTEAIAGFERTRTDQLNLTRARLHLAFCTFPIDRERAHAIMDQVAREAHALGAGGVWLADQASAWHAVHRIAPVEQPTPGIQWAGSVRAVSSQYEPENYSALQALGAPDVYPRSGDYPIAWATKTEDAPSEFLELGFALATRARGIRIYETFHPGAITSVELTIGGSRQAVFHAAAAPLAEPTRILAIDFPCTALPVDAVRVTLASDKVPGYSELDAIGLVTCTP